MRLYPVLALMTSAFALAACAGGGGGGFGASVLGVSSGVGNSCPITNVDGTPDADCTAGNTGGGTPPVVIVDADNDGIDDNATDENGDPLDNNGTTGSGAGGNIAQLTTGNRTIFMKYSYAWQPD